MQRRSRRVTSSFAVIALCLTVLVTISPVVVPPVGAQAAIALTLPNRPDSVKFVAMGDNGTGQKPQYEIGALMAQARQTFPFDFVIMLGDNMYGSQRAKDFVTKFEAPYKVLLDGGVKFYAALGNHDKQENRFYKPWNMNGERYYTYTKKHVRFFVLDTDYLDRPQQDWLEAELSKSTDDWKVVYFHHPLYSSANRHGSETDLRVILEPMFIKHGVNVVFSGHDHIYERVKPQNDIYYFVSGAAGQLRRGDLRRSTITAAGFDQDQSFMLVEIDKDEMSVQAVARSGKTVDSATLPRLRQGQ
jgi:predicted phosphodiesterase